MPDTPSSSLQQFIRRNLLLGVVFLTGAGVLVMEVIAVRVLSPYFGNTIFTFSSVIGVVLAALSAGYYLGGKLADRWPREDYFYAIITLSGLLVLLATALARLLLPFWAYSLSLKSGPMITSCLLFALPSVLLGTLSPFVIKLQEQRCTGQGIGSISGTVFFWSTLGSISGSLGAGFLLIPHFGIFTSLFGVSGLLLGIGIIGYLAHNQRPEKRLSLLGVVLFGTFLSGSFYYMITPSQNLLFIADGVYERISVYDGQLWERDARLLLMDRSLASAVYKDDYDELVFDYSKYHRLTELYTPEVRRALVIGAGAYSIPRALRQQFPEADVDVVDIEPLLKEISEEYFGLQEDPQIHHIFEDGRRFLHDAPHQYDLIFGDAYASLYFIPPHLTTQEFLVLIKDKLAPGGIFVGNFIASTSRQRPSLLLSEIRTFQTVFDNHAVFATNSRADTGGQNLLFLGINGERTADFCAPEYTESGDDFLATMCNDWLPLDRYVYDDDPVFSDNYAPVEYFSAKLIDLLENTQDGFSAPEALALLHQQTQYEHASDQRQLIETELWTLGYSVTTEGDNISGQLGEATDEIVTLAARIGDYPAVAVLLEAARQAVLEDAKPVPLRFVFFDHQAPEADYVVEAPCGAGVCTAKRMAAAGQGVMQYL